MNNLKNYNSFRKVNEGFGFTSTEMLKLDEISKLVGYDDFGDFIGDNPGAYEAITTWIQENFEDTLLDSGESPNELEKLGLYDIAEKLEDEDEDDEDEDDE